MSRFGSFWATRVRGCTIAEHAVLIRLGDRHNETSGRCFPGREGLCFELECSKVYVSQVFGSLEIKKFSFREERFDYKGVQTSNEFKLNFDRWFPFLSDEVEHEEKRLLGYFRRSVKDPEFSKGFHSVWLEKPFFPKANDSKNAFRKNGRTTRPSRKRPLSDKLWIAVLSESHQTYVLHHLTEILAEISEDTGHNFKLEILRAYLKRSD